uniref:Uncharacterized protein n=1 Tax=Spongospora subterranea TaxID=70186 RepID=A0A0H5R8M9_9EUKA|eukprot:CRZ10156.1 hypothetical protein [Spongospora subterranea]
MASKRSWRLDHLRLRPARKFVAEVGPTVHRIRLGRYQTLHRPSGARTVLAINAVSRLKFVQLGRLTVGKTNALLHYRIIDRIAGIVEESTLSLASVPAEIAIYNRFKSVVLDMEAKFRPEVMCQGDVSASGSRLTE